MARREGGLNRATGTRATREAARAQIAAVVAQVRSEGSAGHDAEVIYQIPLSSLRRPRWQSRQDYEVADLVQSIAEHGVLEPIGVWLDLEERQGGEGEGPVYRVLFGNRRVEAVAALHAGRLGEAEASGAPSDSVPVPGVPARVFRCASELEAALLTVAENRRRRDLCMIEEGREMEQLAALLREHGLPATDRDLAPVYEMSFGVVNLYRRVGREITDEILLEAGFQSETAPAQVDWSRARDLKQAVLQRALKATGVQRLEVLRGGGKRNRPTASAEHRNASEETALYPSPSPSPVDGAHGGEASVPTALAPDGGTPLEGTHRYSYEHLRNHGEFQMRLSQPFSGYPAEKASLYLRDLLTATAALGDQVAADRCYVYAQAGQGRILYLRRDPAMAESVEELHAAAHAVDLLLARVREGAMRLGYRAMILRFRGSALGS